jgi:DNA-binding ferritin-like protein (Dps family)
MSDTEKGSFIAKMISPERRWRAYKERVRQLPENYRTTVDAVERYLMFIAPRDRDSAESKSEDLADLFEQAAADGTPVREIVGDDPVEFVETFVANYSDGGYDTAGAGTGKEKETI